MTHKEVYDLEFKGIYEILDEELMIYQSKSTGEYKKLTITSFESLSEEEVEYLKEIEENLT